MDWAHVIAALVSADSNLCFLGCGHEMLDNEHVRWPGERPGSGWLRVWRWVLLRGRLLCIELPRTSAWFLLPAVEITF